MNKEAILLRRKIWLLERKFAKTDYIASKLAEANAKDIANGAWASGNWEHTTAVYNEYADIIKQRDEWRAEINRLETQLAELKQ